MKIVGRVRDVSFYFRGVFFLGWGSVFSYADVLKIVCKFRFVLKVVLVRGFSLAVGWGLV